MCMPLMSQLYDISAEESGIVLLGRQLHTRRRLQCNPFYPEEAQIDCPKAGCVGIGYAGSDQVMCFICEHQWKPQVAGLATTMGSLVLKECPNCEVWIEKNGGCDHMTC